MIVTEEYIRSRFIRLPKRDIDTLVALNELLPLSPESELPVETARNPALLESAMEDWLEEAFYEGLFTSFEYVSLSERVRRIL